MDKGNSSRFDGYPCPQREEARQVQNRKRRFLPLWLREKAQVDKAVDEQMGRKEEAGDD